ncbi:YwqI/YxiC family protein [Oceanobacillus sp. CFH 90083]|uniref:YwqI/YxiC family protein n=1 Tax=Oceanobacillus sp. CFH 90083 TaxID=2592336 RepID=UPI00128E0E8C|nr:YwqI/YxiC family protein [Oceanobacillus sp. CFH 90083]
MSKEIKVYPEIAKQGVSEMRSLLNTMELSFDKEVKGKNVLDMTDKINEINKELHTVLELFEQTFLQNLQAAEEAIDKMKETDAVIARDLSLRERSVQYKSNIDLNR